MHSVLRAASLALGSVFIVFSGLGQTPELPAIFAPRPPAAEISTSRPLPPSPAVSKRVRLLINSASERVLDEVVLPDAPAPSNTTSLDLVTGATVMAPVFVKAAALKDSQVRVPSLRMYHFVPFGSDKFRRVAGGATAPLFHTFIGKTEMQIDLSVLNLGGKGIDHNIDFTRAEIAVIFKW